MEQRTPNPTPTPRQLAYIEELKTRLLLMRQRQITFMEQTAKMLNRISSVNMTDDVVSRSVSETSAEGGVIPSAGVSEDGLAESKSSENIKQLIQRFEDLRQNSEKFNDLPDVPQELINVDVRRILKDYEKLIDEGNIIQQSWFLLKKSTESCVRFATNSVFQTASEDRPIVQTSSENVKVSQVLQESCPPLILPEEVATPSLQTSFLYSRMPTPPQDSKLDTGAEFVDKEKELLGPEENVKDSNTDKNRGTVRWGPFMRLIIRLLKPMKLHVKSKKKPNQKLSSSSIARQLPPPVIKPHKMH